MRAVRMATWRAISGRDRGSTAISRAPSIGTNTRAGRIGNPNVPPSEARMAAVM